MIEIVKPQLDFGLLTARPEVVAFWRDEAKLRLDHVLPVVKGHDQYRFDVGGSVIKVNLISQLDTKARSGYRELWIAKPECAEPRELADPDGNRLRFVPMGCAGVRQIGVRLRVSDLERSRWHYRDALGFSEETPGRLRCGDSLLLLEESADAPAAVEARVMGWLYLTVQVRDCDAEVARLKAAGVSIASPPRNLGEVARMAMVRDPDGNLLEVSQRASLTGPLPNA